uniref:Uncharacterized protein n=1 Tax=Timema poppense TaxID=170557 RepID=A0A7R9DB90_TIMPO|nr:unnamed protein product [Timema poppensis]
MTMFHERQAHVRPHVLPSKFHNSSEIEEEGFFLTALGRGDPKPIWKERIVSVPTPLVDPSNAVGDNVSAPVFTGVDVRGSRTRLGAWHNKSL